MNVSSAYGKGSNFSFWIPVGEIASASLVSKKPGTRSAPVKEEEDRDQHFIGSVLLVEDTLVNQKLLAKVLGLHLLT